MELQLVNFEQAKVLKELGFPQDIENYSIYYIYGQPVKFQNTYEGYPYTYNIGDVVCLSEEYANGSYEIGTTNDDNYVIAPSFGLVAKWLKEEKNLILLVGKLLREQIYFYTYEIDNKYYGSSTDYNTYEEALSAGIDKAIEILKK